MFFYPKVTYSTAIKIQKLADFLLLTIWKDYYTGFSGKVFEYLHSEKPIILDYNPAPDLIEFLQDYKNVHYCNESVHKLKGILNSEITNSIISHDLKAKISRSYQVEKLNKFLLEEIIS